MLEVTRLDNLVQQYFNKALALSTMRTYNSARVRYLNFCTTVNVTPLPINQSYMCQYVALLASQRVSHKSYISALRHLQIASLGSDPGFSNMTVLTYVLQGIKHSQAQLGTNRPHTHPPITTELMRVLKRAWEIQGASFNSIMLWAAACTCFFGFLRSGEATVPTLSGYDPEVHLSLSDVALDSHDSPQMVLIRIKASKTDPFRLGVTVCLGKTNQELT